MTGYTGSIVDCSSCSLLWGWCVPPKFHTLRSFLLTPLSSFTFILLCIIVRLGETVDEAQESAATNALEYLQMMMK